MNIIVPFMPSVTIVLGPLNVRLCVVSKVMVSLLLTLTNVQLAHTIAMPMPLAKIPLAHLTVYATRDFPETAYSVLTSMNVCQLTTVLPKPFVVMLSVATLVHVTRVTVEMVPHVLMSMNV